MSHAARSRVVAVPGFGGAAGDFDVLRDRLPGWDWCPLTWPGCDGTTYDPAGFDYSAKGLCSWLDTVVEPRDWLLGYSMGGRLAYQALASGLQVAGVVIVGAVPDIGGDEIRRDRRDTDERLAQRALELGAAEFADRWAAHPLIATQRRMIPVYREALLARRRRNDPAALAAALRLFGQGSTPPVLEAVCARELPTLLVSGAEDTKYTDQMSRLAARWPRALHRVIPAGHAAHLEAPDVMSDVLETFWRGG